MSKIIREQLIIDYFNKNRDYINALRQGYERDLAEIFKQIVIISVAVIGFNIVNTIDQLKWNLQSGVWLISNSLLIIAIYLTLRFYYLNASMQTLEVERVQENKKQSVEVEQLREKLNELQVWVFWLFGIGILLTLALTVYNLVFGGK